MVDFSNLLGCEGYVIMVGMFFGEFVEIMFWVYFDIVGIVIFNKVICFGLFGVIGVMVRIFVIFVE